MVAEKPGNGAVNGKGNSPNSEFSKPVHWAALTGRWSFEMGVATYEGPSEEQSLPYGLALSDLRLRDGVARVIITFESLTKTSAGLLLGYHSEPERYIDPQLGGWDSAYALSEFNAAWKPLMRAGSIQNLHSGQPYELEIRQAGQRIVMLVDGIQIFEYVLSSPLTGNQVGLYAWGKEKIKFEKLEVSSKPPRAFVAMQFGEPFDAIYHEVIQPEGEKLGLQIVRVDELTHPGIIFEDIKREISDSKVVIAEITAPNQNVFYELGYAHALNKPTILLAQRGRELPFDIRSYRLIFYDDSISGKPEVERNLSKHLRAVLQES